MSRTVTSSLSSSPSAVEPRSRQALGLCRRNYGRQQRRGRLRVGLALGLALLVSTPALSAADLDTWSPVGTVTPAAFDAFDRGRDAPSNEDPYYRSDGVYGRFDGELFLAPSLGTQWTASGWFTQLGLSAFYLNTVGVSFRYADGRWAAFAPRSDFSVSTLSLSLRPLFLIRWSKDWERGPSFLDLAIDSLTLSVGSYWSLQHGADLQKAGLETELSLGFPILGRAQGPWLTASAANRWPKVTNDGKSLDMAYGLRFEWAFSLSN